MILCTNQSSMHALTFYFSSFAFAFLFFKLDLLCLCASLLCACPCLLCLVPKFLAFSSYVFSSHSLRFLFHFTFCVAEHSSKSFTSPRYFLKFKHVMNTLAVLTRASRRMCLILTQLISPLQEPSVYWTKSSFLLLVIICMQTNSD